MCHMNVARLTNEVEAVSQIYASRYGIERDATWFILKLQEEVGELTQAFLMLTGRARDRVQPRNSRSLSNHRPRAQREDHETTIR